VLVAFIVKELRKRESKKADPREEFNKNMDMELEGKAQELAFKAARLQLTRERDEEILGSELFIRLVSDKRQMLRASARTSDATSAEHQRVRFEQELMQKLQRYQLPPEATSSSPDRKSPKRKRSPSLSPVPSLMDNLEDVKGCEPS
jgi:hypothetical protein